MRCPACGGATLIRACRDLPYTYKGQTTIIASVQGLHCPMCNECVPDVEEARRVSEEALAFNKEVNAGLIDPAEIRAAREALQLGQREAGLLLGGGINGFNRYEAGKIRPPKALVLLLRLVRNHPELLDELREDLAGTPMRGPTLAVQERTARRVRTSYTK